MTPPVKFSDGLEDRILGHDAGDGLFDGGAEWEKHPNNGFGRTYPVSGITAILRTDRGGAVRSDDYGCLRVERDRRDRGHPSREPESRGKPRYGLPGSGSHGPGGSMSGTDRGPRQVGLRPRVRSCVPAAGPEVRDWRLARVRA